MKQTTNRSNKAARVLATARKCAGKETIEGLRGNDVLEAMLEFPMFVGKGDWNEYRRGVNAAMVKANRATETEDGNGHPGFTEMFAAIVADLIRRFFDEATYEKSLESIAQQSDK